MNQEELRITDDFMFCKVMEDNPELCRTLIELILKQELGEIELVQKQKTIEITADGRGVRLDVYAKMKDIVCNIEMQTTNKKDHGKRVRFYQSMVDSDLLDKGESFKALCRSYVIFICPFDPFENDERVYRFETMCREHPEINLQTEAETLFVCATEKTVQLQDGLGHFLEYLLRNVPTDKFTNDVHGAVKRASKDAKWRREMYTWKMKIEEEKELAAAKARQNTQQDIILNMTNLGLEAEEIAKLINVPVEMVVEVKNSISGKEG